MTFKSLFRRLRPSRFRRNEHGSATIEFVILFPVMMMIFLSSFEMSIWMLRQVWMDRAMDLTVRDLRLGAWPNLNTHPDARGIVKRALCDRMGTLMGSCESQLMLELVPVPKDTWVLPDPGAQCIDRGDPSKPIATFRDGPENEIMLVRACVIVDPFFTGTSWGLQLEKNPGDGFAMVSTSAYVNEPRVNSN